MRLVALQTYGNLLTKIAMWNSRISQSPYSTKSFQNFFVVKGMDVTGPWLVGWLE